MTKRIIFFLLFIPQLFFGQNLLYYLKKNQPIDPEKSIIQLKKDYLQNKDPKRLLLIGECYECLNQDDSAFAFFLKAKDEFVKKKQIDYSNEICFKIHGVISSLNFKKYRTLFLDKFIEYSYKKKSAFLLALAKNEIGKMEIDKFDVKTRKNTNVLNNAEKAFKEGLEYAKKCNNELVIAKIYSNLATTKRNLNQYDSCKFYFNKSIHLNIKNKETNELFINYFNLGNAFFVEKKYTEALFKYKSAEKIKLPYYKLKSSIILSKKISDTYYYLNDYENCLQYLDNFIKLKDSLNEVNQKIAINDIQTKYETQEKELENLKLKSNIKFNKIISFLSIGLLLVIIIISTLAYKNLSKKKKITEQEKLIEIQKLEATVKEQELAEQEKLLEIQKLETTLKEQELHVIDVMLESQEKERQRIANELHDNLGSMLATLKLNFENLKRHDTDSGDKEAKLFEKTDSLIDEAYQKVRNISHLKNLGVIGSEGLVVAVKKMAEKMSVLNKLQINVIPHGLNERLENTLEVMLFRIIQELCTNIIKHSEATEVNINLTQYENSELNIIVEDNGKGFDSKNIVATSGIGLKNIEKKIEQMNGRFTIDSNVSGTSIIIDLPI